MTSPLQPPARLSYIGVPRSLAWGYSYGSLCFVAAGTAAVTFSEDWMLVMCFVACLAACYARFVGTRVHVAVWSRGADDGYEVMTRVFGVTSRYIASRVPELDFSELNNAAWVQTESLRSSQLALKLKLGSSTLLLPSLHAGAGLADARARLEPFRAALLALAELSGKPQTYEHVRQEGRLWTFPKFPERGNPHIEELRWANGEPDKVMLRHGMTRLLLPEGRAEASFLGLAALLVAASAVLPSDQSLTHRAGFAAGALSLALIAFAFATLELRVRLERHDAASAAAVVREYRILGVCCWARRVPVGDGLRVLYVQEYDSESEGSGTSVTANLVTRDNALHDLIGVGDESDPSREQLNALGASLSNPELMEDLLREPPQNDARQVHPALDPNYEEPPPARPPPAFVLRSRLAAFAALLGVFVLLTGFGSAIADLADLSHTTRWVQTTYYVATIPGAKHSEDVARPSLDRHAILRPTPPLNFAYSGFKCWVLDNPRGHDIARYVPPTGPPTLREEIRMSTVANLAIYLLLAFAAAGPWLRARRSFLVHAG